MGVSLFLRDNRAFCILHALLLLLGSCPLLVFDKVALLLKLNSFHNPFFDQFFYYITFLGSSAMYALLIVILALMHCNNRVLLTGVFSFVVMSSIVQIMKRFVFGDQLRPTALIPSDVPLHLVDGLVPDTHLSLPSGHAATIFTAVCLIHFLMPKKPIWLSILLFLGAVIVAYSRVYLCQHFYRDIYVGAWVGISITTLVYLVLMHWQGSAWLDQKPFTSIALLLATK